ncbi:hypothetical protein BDV40DRAFT_75945 [Aspergillus tamarii]|uniref:Uncharacterized protein n=1 Tax=Aspergillus tamarii TaxID=41984 RepID=A0A5N6UD56_ASPTM|nr:hypothetical protein BDV40DRAFT_75945 [Aspergillus tamarii]
MTLGLAWKKSLTKGAAVAEWTFLILCTLRLMELCRFNRLMSLFFFFTLLFLPASFYCLSYALLSSSLSFLFNIEILVERSAQYDQLICS